MSFSADLKKELSELNNLANKEIVIFEFIGYLMSNYIIQKNEYIKFSTESEYNINRFSKLLKNLQINNYNIKISGKIFSITVKLNEVLKSEEICKYNELINFKKNKINIDILNIKLEQVEEFKKALIRGCFLGGGSVNNPKKGYHLEILFSKIEYANCIEEILKKYDIRFKTISKNQKYSTYIKEAEQISKFLAYINASNSVLKFEELRVLKDVKNKVNRKVNCETANLNKIVETSIKQIDSILYLKEIGEFKKLSKPLQEIALIRQEHPESSLIELGQMLKKPLGKSGVNYRLKAIEKKAEELKNIN